MNADSVKARLKNFAVSSGCTFQEALVYYGLERTIYRISASPYASHFVLKGGIFLYAVFNRKYERTTTDVDLLARRISNSAEEMKAVFRDIFTQDTDDALVFDLDSITAEDITEFKNGFLNSRYKDFYDIYVLSEKYPFNYEVLHNAVTETFTNRKTLMTMDTDAFSDEFLGDAVHKTRWNSFLKKKKAIIQVSMNDAMARIKTFVAPLLTQTDESVTKWDPHEGCWK